MGTPSRGRQRTRDPELRLPRTASDSQFRPGGEPSLAESQTQEWEEVTSFFDVVCWREMAENVSETLTPEHGDRHRRLEQRSWETAEGDKRSKIEVVADELGPACAGRPHR